VWLTSTLVIAVNMHPIFPCDNLHTGKFLDCLWSKSNTTTEKANSVKAEDAKPRV
jgi:hypothetical protein